MAEFELELLPQFEVKFSDEFSVRPEQASVQLWLPCAETLGERGRRVMGAHVDFDVEEARRLSGELRKAANKLEAERRARRPYGPERDYPLNASPS